MKNAIAVVVSALGGAACGAAIALLCCGPVREEAAGEEGGAGKALGSRPASLPEVNAGSANGAPEEIEVSRTPIVADAERALTELKAELDRARTELGRAQEQLDGVRAELAFARENPAEDFFRRFKALEMTQGLTEAEKTSLFVHVVKPLWELPKAEQIRPLQGGAREVALRLARGSQRSARRSKSPRRPALLGGVRAVADALARGARRGARRPREGACAVRVSRTEPEQIRPANRVGPVNAVASCG
jgi:hypothetical protein